MIELSPLTKKISIRTQVPTSKSYTNRALLLAALADGKSTIQNPLESDDTKVMIKALKELGVKITRKKSKKGGISFKVQGLGGKLNKPSRTLYLGNAGTAVRFLTAALSNQDFKSKVTGNKRMQERPLKDLIEALTLLGAEIKSTKNNHCPPITIKGPLTASKTTVEGSISSQYLSALLMTAPTLKSEVSIKVKGKLTSLPYIIMTLDIINSFGVRIKHKDFKEFQISPAIYKPQKYHVEGDASSATYPLAMAAISGGKATITNLNKNSKQADLKFLDILKKMGCTVSKTDKQIQVEGPKQVKPLGTIDLNALPDAAMTVAVLCSFAEGKSKLTNIGNLRVKETDRLHALKTELKKIGVKVKDGPDYLEIDGNPEKLHGATIETYDDHRMAMCFAVAGSKIPGIKIKNPECTTKTYPTFWKDLKKWGIKSKKI